jgi:hypothetical protein
VVTWRSDSVAVAIARLPTGAGGAAEEQVLDLQQRHSAVRPLCGPGDRYRLPVPVHRATSTVPAIGARVGADPVALARRWQRPAAGCRSPRPAPPPRPAAAPGGGPTAGPAHGASGGRAALELVGSVGRQPPCRLAPGQPGGGRPQATHQGRQGLQRVGSRISAPVRSAGTGEAQRAVPFCARGSACLRRAAHGQARAGTDTSRRRPVVCGCG